MSIRIGLIGLGSRGMATLRRYQFIEGAHITALADISPEKLDAANAVLAATGRAAARPYAGPDAWQDVCRDADIDLIYICTDWSTHTAMACFAMEQGKHVAVEVPAATTVAECWQLVDTAERTGCHCFMTENCCYDFYALQTLEMHRQGRFGTITHCEGAYIHDLRSELGLSPDAVRDAKVWMERGLARNPGNAYPTHGMGPIGWLLNLHRGDRMEYLVSMSAAGTGEDQMLGRVNTTLIHCASGITIALQLDVTTPRPYNRLQTICGTKGFAQKYPLPTLQFADGTALTGDAALSEAARYATSDAARRWQRGHDLGVPNEMNFAMDSRLIHCLNNGLPLDIDVYDTAEWSCLAELSARSVSLGSQPVEIPDFTRGRWRTMPPHKFH